MALKVLVLENTEGVSEILNISLSNDYDVLTVANTDEALKIVRETHPPIVIFDMNASDMDGIDFLCRIKKKSPQTEVITLTDQNSMEKGITSLKYEASDFIVKPVSSKPLEIVLERAMRKRAMRKKLTASSSSDVFPSAIDTERASLAKQIIRALNISCIPSDDSQTDHVSGLMAIHTRNGKILCASESHKKIFGNMEGRDSAEMFKRGGLSMETCPAAIAFQTGKKDVREIVTTFSREGNELTVRVVASPLLNTSDQVDLVLEIITL